MLIAGRVALKQHRAEVALASVGALVVGSVALLFYLTSAGAPSDEVTSYILGAMKVLPFALGLVGGIPIVSRELEARTAQVAWSLNSSRRRWLIRQVVPIAILLGTAMSFAALATLAIAGPREAIGEQAVANIGSHGVPAVARAAAAFGVGLFVGAFFGRALPALIIGAVLVLGLFSIASSARDMWIANLSPVVPLTQHESMIQTGWAMVTPDGDRISVDEAMTRVPADEQEPETWLEANGYQWLALGVDRARAMQFEWYDAGFFAVVGLFGIAGTVLIVDRRRPR